MGNLAQQNSTGTDEELSLLICQSDIPAFKTIYYRYYEKLCRFVWTKTSSPEFEDIVQDVFSKLWANRKKLIKIKSFQAYIYRITNNMIIDFYRKKSGRSEHVRLETTKLKQSTEKSLDDSIDLDSAIHILPEKIREVFLLSRFEGLKYSEIAVVCNVSVKTVESRLSKALNLLRENLG